MKREIKEFIKGDKQILEIEYNSKKNVLYKWNKIIFPLRFIYNFLIIKISKYMPMHTKIFFLKFFLKMNIGKNTGIGPETEIDPFYPELITIQEDVIVGWKVNLLTHDFTHDKLRFGKTILKKGCLVGGFSTIKAGVNIGKNSIIAMNSFVNKDIPDNEIWGGVPAKFIKKNKF
jgi:acetyltransferase-like isoleucine patch superfamily enzyme